MRTLAADTRYAVRVLTRTPAFTAAVVAVLALGIGANTAIFSIVNAVLLRPLPLDGPDRLVRIVTRPPQETFRGATRFAVSAGKFYDWQRTAQSFEGMGLYRTRRFALTGSGPARSVDASAVSPGFFDLLRVEPVLGRTFRNDEDTQGNHRVAVVSHRFWTSVLGGATDAIGRVLTLNDEPYTVVGVAPPRASFASWNGTSEDIWVPLALSPGQRADRANHNLRTFARLKPGVDATAAQAEMDAISARLAREFPDTDGSWGATVIPMQEEIVGASRRMLVVLLGAVGLVLLIACANVGNLLFARALGRRKEIAIRSALGAGRGRVFQQLLVEAVLLATAGGALGLWLARMSLSASAALLAGRVPRGDEISIDVQVMLFAFGVSLITGMLAGTLPALRAGRADVGEVLKDGGRSDGAIGIGTRRLLIVCEVALSVVLLMSAAVMLKSVLTLRHAETGFDPANVLTMHVTLPAARYPTAAQRSAFYDTALQRIRALPGVESAGTIDYVPLVGGSFQSLAPEGYPVLSPQQAPIVQMRQVTPGYMRTMKIPVLRGRDVAENDAAVLLVSQQAAALFWGTDDPLGRRAFLNASKDDLLEVVGIVGDVKQLTIESGPAATVYYYRRERGWGAATFAIRTTLPPGALAQAAAAAIHAVDPLLPVENVRTMEQVIETQLASPRFTAALLGAFAAVALLLASIGIYSVLSYIVRGRSREIGIRTALGAGTTDVLRLVVREGMAPAVWGIAAGAAGALAAARLLQRLVSGVSAADPVTLAIVASTLALVALAASIVPAYRASKLDPLKVLRGE